MSETSGELRTFFFLPSWTRDSLLEEEKNLALQLSFLEHLLLISPVRLLPVWFNCDLFLNLFLCINCSTQLLFHPIHAALLQLEFPTSNLHNVFHCRVRPRGPADRRPHSLDWRGQHSQCCCKSQPIAMPIIETWMPSLAMMFFLVGIALEGTCLPSPKTLS